MAEGLEISTGPGRGEAAFLGESSFDPVANARRVGETIRVEQERKKAQQRDDFSLLNDDIKTKWDTDTFNYFEPRIQQLKTSIVDVFKKQNGELTPIQRMEFKNSWDKLKNEADVSNATFASYAKQVQDLDKNPDKFDLEESRANLNILRDPLSNPETKKEVEQVYGGNVLKWRADNASKYTLAPAFSREAFIQDLMKGKGLDEQVLYDKDKAGNPILYKNEAGGYEYRIKKGVSDDQLETKVNAIWSDTDRKSERTREQDLKTVKEKFIIDEFGNPVLRNEADVIGQEVLKRAKLKGKITPDEVYKELGKAYTFADLRNRFKLEEQVKPASRQPVGRSGGSKGFDDKYKVAETPYKTGDVNIATTLPGQTWVNQAAGKGHTVRRVAIESQGKGGDTESIQLSISGKPVRPIGYLVDDETGEVYMEYASKEEAGVNRLTNAPIYKDKYSATLVGQNISANIAAKYGFNSWDEFKSDVLKIKRQSVPAKGKQGGGAAPNKTKKATFDPKNPL
jgi:hypothetical protein